MFNADAIAHSSLRFAHERFHDTKFVADRLLHEVAQLNAAAESEGLDEGAAEFLEDLQLKSDQAEARHQHAYNKLRWELAQ